MVDDHNLDGVAQQELEYILTWVLNSYLEEQPLDLIPTLDEVADALQRALVRRDQGPIRTDTVIVDGHRSV